MLNKGSELRSLEVFDEVIFHYGQDLDPVVVECVARAFLNSGMASRSAGV